MEEKNGDCHLSEGGGGARLRRSGGGVRPAPGRESCQVGLYTTHTTAVFTTISTATGRK